MSDAVMVPREAKRQLIVDLDAAPFTREFLDALNGYATGGSGRCLDTLSIWNARLAASPSVGGWEDDPYLATDLALVNDLIYQHGGDAALAGWVRLCRRITAAPPSVSTGSRPREAVPGELAEGEVLVRDDGKRFVFVRAKSAPSRLIAVRSERGGPARFYLRDRFTRPVAT